MFDRETAVLLIVVDDTTQKAYFRVWWLIVELVEKDEVGRDWCVR